MKSLLSKTSNWKFIVPAFIAFAVCLYLFQGAQERMNLLAGEEAPMIDMRNDYTMQEISDFFTKLKEEGRKIHQHTTGITDMIFPFAYGFLFILLSAYFLKKIAGPNSNWMYLSLIPILLMLADFKENFNTLNLLNQYPNLTEEMVAKASLVTGVKSTLTEISMALPIILGVVYLAKKFMNR